MPVDELADQPPNHRRQRRAQHTPQRSIGDIRAPFARSDDVADDPVGQGYGAAATGALETAQDEEGGVAVL